MTSRKIKQVGALSIVFAALLAGMQPAEAAFTTGSGVLSDATIAGAVRYRNFNSTGGKEVYLDSPNLVLNADATSTCCAAGSSNDISWGISSSATAQTWNITFEYDGTTLKTVATKGATSVTTQKAVGALGSLNYLALETNIGNAARNVVLQNATVFKGATNLGTIWSASGSTAGLHQLYAAYEDLTGAFKVTASVIVTGNPQPGGDSNYVQMKVGYVAPPDNLAPIVSNVHVTPASPLLNGSADAEANVDDTTTGNSTITEANYQLNLDPWAYMAAFDGNYDGVAEDVIATTSPLTRIAVNTVCVKGKDSANNESGTTATASHHPCLDFVVAYAFDGFFSPVDNGVVNSAKAAQAIPFKWRLTDANGDPISDPASFAFLKSYPVDCGSLLGSIADAVEEYAAGDSGLQYNGDGYWQFNWKTPKSYASTCRAAYVEFNSTQISDVVTFMFKK